MSVDLRALMGKVADAPKNNEDDTNKGIENVYGPPHGRSPGTLDARWGDTPPPPETYGTGTKREARDGRNEMLERLFDSPRTSADVEQKLLRQNLTHFNEAHSHSPLLQRGRVKEASGEETLTDSVMRVVGHR